MIALCGEFGQVVAMKKLALLTAAALTVIGLSAAPAQAATTAQIVVSGTGQVSVKRDQATTILTVSVTESTAKAALNSATLKFNTVRAAVIAVGAKPEELTTTGLSLYPEYDYSTGKAPTIIGYRASISLSVVTTVALAPTVVDQAVEAGGDALSLNGISFDTANPDASTATARTRAVAAAKSKAAAYAKLLGMKLGKAIKVVETSAPTPTPIYSSADKVAASGIVLDPGTAKVTVSVEVTFRLV